MTKRKDGRWQEAVTINGVRKYFYGKTKAEVNRKITAHKEKLGTGILYGDFLDIWEPHTMLGKRPNTVIVKGVNIKHARYYLGDIPIKNITPPMVRDAMEEFATTHSVNSCGFFLSVLRESFAFAVSDGYINTNPAREIKVPDNARKTPPRKPLSREDVQRVLAGVDKPFGLFGLALLTTGLRKGELLALRYEDINRQDMTITVSKQLDTRGNAQRIVPPKTDASISTVPLLPILANALPNRQKGIVFSSRLHGKDNYIGADEFKRLWAEYCQAIGITATPHQFRHEYATALFEAGIPPEDIQILVRHGSLSTTMQTYVDIREAKIKSARERALSANLLT